MGEVIGKDNLFHISSGLRHVIGIVGMTYRNYVLGNNGSLKALKLVVEEWVFVSGNKTIIFD